MEEFRCQDHSLSGITTCNWCGDPVCEKCVASSDYKKYCEKCFTKLSKDSVADYLEKKWEDEQPRSRLYNIDPSLDDEEIKRKRQIIEFQEKARKIIEEGNQ